MAALREALATNLSAIADTQWSAYRLSAASPPCGYVWIGPISYDKAMHRGADDVTLMVTVLASLVTDIGGQKNLQRYMDASGSSSVKAAVEADTTLGGNCAQARVVECSGEQIYVPEGKGPYIGADFTVAVLT